MTVNWQRVTTVVATCVVAIVAAVVSYSHMQTLALRSGEAWRSWLIPISVDGLIVAASMVLLAQRRNTYAWCAVATGVAASLAANMAAARPEYTSVLVAAWAPMAFAYTLHLLLQQRHEPAVTIRAALAATELVPTALSELPPVPASETPIPAAAAPPQFASAPKVHRPRPKVETSGSGPRTNSASLDAVAALRDQGLTREQIVERLGSSPRTITRRFAELDRVPTGLRVLR